MSKENKQHKWTLRPGGKKDICPQCGRRRFVPYVLTADNTVKAGGEYGRCDREQSCGYFRYPGKGVGGDHAAGTYTPPPPLPPLMMDRSIADNAVVTAGNGLLEAFAPLLGRDNLASTMAMYHCGTAGTACVFIQFDGEHVRTGKAICYGADGHRLKGVDGGAMPVWWLHKCRPWVLHAQTRQLRQCLFGQHLLRDWPGVPVWVVEAEKTAVLMAAVDNAAGPGEPPRRLWLACGGSQMLKGAIDLSCLQGRAVTLVPDDKQQWNWARTAAANRWKLYDIEPLKERYGLPDGCDIWDVAEAVLKRKGGRP